MGREEWNDEVLLNQTVALVRERKWASWKQRVSLFKYKLLDLEISDIVVWSNAEAKIGLGSRFLKIGCLSTWTESWWRCEVKALGCYVFCHVDVELKECSEIGKERTEVSYIFDKY